MWDFITEILKIFQRVFGKILDDINDKSFIFWKKITSPKPFLYQQLLDLPYVRYGNNRCYYGKCYNLEQRSDLLQKVEYKIFFDKLNFFKSKYLIKKLINNCEIRNYNDADRFVISLIILFESLSKRNITKIYEIQKENNQATIICSFLREVRSVRLKLLNKEIVEHLKNS